MYWQSLVSFAAIWLSRRPLDLPVILLRGSPSKVGVTLHKFFELIRFQQLVEQLGSLSAAARLPPFSEPCLSAKPFEYAVGMTPTVNSHAPQKKRAQNVPSIPLWLHVSTYPDALHL